MARIVRPGPLASTGLALAVGLAGLGGFGGQAGEGAEPLAGGESGRVAHAGGQRGPADLSHPGQQPGEPGWVHGLVAGFALGGVDGELGLGGAQQPHFGRDFGGQADEVDGGVAVVERERRLGVPDIAGNASGVSGYYYYVDGERSTMFGTSAVAPLYAGLLAVIIAEFGEPIGFLNPTLYALGSSVPGFVFSDIPRRS
jgi:hypothetical protein